MPVILLGTLDTTTGDAHLELGDYAEAETAYRQLSQRNPGPAVDSRLARLAWLQGQPDKALSLMGQAGNEAAPGRTA